MRIAAINVDLMTTVTVTTVGAKRRCPRMQEKRRQRGSGVAPDPDKWLTMRTVSAGGGHGPILLGKLEAGEWGSISLTQRPTNSYVNLQGDFLH